MIGLPKTIDNDIYGTDVTFGFHTAVDIAADALRRIRTTADSHRRVFFVEVMGNKVGWLTLYAGLAAGADAILLPEMPYDEDNIIKFISEKRAAGARSVVIAVAEGAMSKREADMSKKGSAARLPRAVRQRHRGRKAGGYHLAEVPNSSAAPPCSGTSSAGGRTVRLRDRSSPPK